MSMLSSKQIKNYKDHGFVAPIDVLSLQEASKIKGEIEYIDESQTDIVHVRNETITDFSPYQKYVDACNDGNKA